MADGGTRKRPNVLITGTPGVGKTTLAVEVADRLGMRHVNVGELIREHKCHSGRDEALETDILDEDRLLDLMEPLFEEAAEEGTGIVADFHVCEIFPERWFDLVLVLRATTEVLFDRLTARGYAGRKREENMEAEIMQVVLEEARGAYDPNIVHEVPSNHRQDTESAVRRIEEWSRQWMADNNGADE